VLATGLVLLGQWWQYERCFSPQHYLLLHGADAETVNYYQRRCKGQGDILELGCGDARVLRAVAQSPGASGHQFVGIDNVPDFISSSQALPGSEGIRAIHADMCNFTLDQTFDMIVMPSSTLFCLESTDQILNCFKCVRRHLKSQGELAFDTYNVDMVAEEDWGFEDAGESEYGKLIRSLPDEDAFEKNAHVAGEQMFVCRYTHVPKSDDGTGKTPISYELRHRYLKTEQIEELVTKAGFYVDSVAGGFSDQEFEPESSPRLVASCRLAPEGWKVLEWEDVESAVPEGAAGSKLPTPERPLR